MRITLIDINYLSFFSFGIIDVSFCLPFLYWGKKLSKLEGNKRDNIDTRKFTSLSSNYHETP